MIKAVIWDFGGVFTASPFDAFRDHEAAHGLPRDFLRTLNATNPDTNAWARFERSEIDLATFDTAFAAEARAAGHEVRGTEIIRLLAGPIRPRMVAALKRCREHLATACITNNVAAGAGPGITFDRQRTRAVAEVMALFDVVLESSRVGIRKPDPEIYRLACARLGVAPAEAVYLDDLGINLKPARALGMTTIKVADPDQALAELAQVLDLAFV